MENTREQIRLDVADQFDRFDNVNEMLEETSRRITIAERQAGWR